MPWCCQNKSYEYEVCTFRWKGEIVRAGHDAEGSLNRAESRRTGLLASIFFSCSARIWPRAVSNALAGCGCSKDRNSHLITKAVARSNRYGFVTSNLPISPNTTAYQTPFTKATAEPIKAVIGHLVFSVAMRKMLGGHEITTSHGLFGGNCRALLMINKIAIMTPMNAPAFEALVITISPVRTLSSFIPGHHQGSQIRNYSYDIDI